MKKYKFIFKPVFFIFNLLFATWLVLKIEKLQPSDFGEYKSLFYSGPKPKIVTTSDKQFLKKLSIQYKKGEIDSLELERQLVKFLTPQEENQSSK